MEILRHQKDRVIKPLIGDGEKGAATNKLTGKSGDASVVSKQCHEQADSELWGCSAVILTIQQTSKRRIPIFWVLSGSSTRVKRV